MVVEESRGKRGCSSGETLRKEVAGVEERKKKVVAVAEERGRGCIGERRL